VFLVGVGISFLKVYALNLRMNAPESSRPTTWWHEFRVYHGVLFVIAAAISLYDQRFAAIPLASDVIVGILLQNFVNEG
jgi:hypothetical protein